MYYARKTAAHYKHIVQFSTAAARDSFISAAPVPRWWKPITAAAVETFHRFEQIYAAAVYVH